MGEHVAAGDRQDTNDVASAMLHLLAESDSVDERLVELRDELHQARSDEVCGTDREGARSVQEIEAEIAELENASDEDAVKVQELHGQWRELRRAPASAPATAPVCEHLVERRPIVARPRERRFRRRTRSRGSPSSDPDPSEPPGVARLGRGRRHARRWAA